MPGSGAAPEMSLRAVVEDVIAERPTAALAARAGQMMAAYRSGRLPGKPVIATASDATAYAAYRMPATVAATEAAIRQARDSLPGWTPASLLDLGAGTGGAAWAAVGELPSIRSVTLLEQSAEAANLGRAILVKSSSPALRCAGWRRWHLAASGGQPPPPLPTADLVTAAYLLGELSDEQQRNLVDLALAAAPAVLLVEPGTPAGHRRILAARTRLLESGFTVAAPCPHEFACPLDIPGDWCHFAARVQRSAVHRQIKGGDLSYEDEKFSFVAMVRGIRTSRAAARVVGRPQLRKNLVSLSLCAADGTTGHQLVTKTEGPRYRAARKASWGDVWENDIVGPLLSSQRQ